VPVRRPEPARLTFTNRRVGYEPGMGEFLIAPIVIFVIAGAVWFVYFSGSVAREKRRMAELRDDPYDRREAELGHMRADHEAARPESASHPAQRP
jgi:hypothetical protein